MHAASFTWKVLRVAGVFWTFYLKILYFLVSCLRKSFCYLKMTSFVINIVRSCKWSWCVILCLLIVLALFNSVPNLIIFVDCYWSMAVHDWRWDNLTTIFSFKVIWIFMKLRNYDLMAFGHSYKELEQRVNSFSFSFFRGKNWFIKNRRRDYEEYKLRII